MQDGFYDAFTERLTDTAGTMKAADAFEPGEVIGPLIDIRTVEKVEAHIGRLKEVRQERQRRQARRPST